MHKFIVFTLLNILLIFLPRSLLFLWLFPFSLRFFFLHFLLLSFLLT